MVVGALMILLSFIGLIIADLKNQGAWSYWRIVGPFFALMCIWLSLYLRRKGHSVSLGTIWHELFHWIALVGAVFLITSFISMGVMGRFQGALVILVLLSLTTFIAGIYIESSYLIVGLGIGLIAVGGAFMQEYLYTVILPVTLVFLGLLIAFVYWMKRRHRKQPIYDEDHLE